MKVYVDELPKDCLDCPCESEYFCNLLNEDVGCLEWGEIHKNCPLQSLADYTKQVRKEVVQEIKDLSGDYLENENQQLKQQLAETEESYNNTMRYLNKIRSILLNLQNTKEK